MMIVGSGWMGSWMMGGRYGLAGDGKPVQSLAAANTRAQAFADRLGLRVGEVMQFSSNYYAELVTAAGRGATEILVNPGNGAVSLEYGPAMMWNSQYGIHPSATSQVRVSPSQAREIADTWLRDQNTGLTAAPDTFPGYYTLHTLDHGKISGMLSVSATTGTVWYHSWHGRYLAMTGG